MKAASLALACALLGATALSPAAFAQSSSQGAQQTPAEASPSTTSPDANARTGTSAQRDWRDQDGRIGGWRRDDDRGMSYRSQSSRYSDEDDDDDDDMQDSRYSSRYDSERGGMQRGGGMDRGGMERGMNRGMGHGHGGGMSQRMTPELMRLHAQMMGAQRGARFNLKRGDSSIRIACPASENLAACVDAVGKLMDRLQAMPQTPK